MAAFLGIWVAIMAAMMLPSAAPTVMMFADVSKRRAGRRVPSWVFVFSYFAVWTAFGLVAYALIRGAHALHLNRGGAYTVAALLVLAGAYELTPFKDVCLRHCRSPLHFVVGRWRRGVTGALRMGAEHGAYCVGCCWGLMVVLFELGMMSFLWMAVVGVLIFAQKVLPLGDRLPFASAVALAAGGIWIAAAA